MSIEERLAQLEKSPAFQKKVEIARKKATQTGKPFGHLVNTGNGLMDVTGSPNGVTDEFVEKIVQQIVDQIRTVLPHMPDTPLEMFRIYKVPVPKQNKFNYKLYFIPWVVHRSSLYPEGYPDGLENIVALRSHGGGPSKNPVWNRAAREWNYNTHRQYGEYEVGGHIFIPKGTVYRPDPFLIDIVNQLNSQYMKDGVQITLENKYYP